MSISFVALLDGPQKPPDLLVVIDRITPLPPAVGRLVERFRDLWRHTEWKVESHDGDEIVGPGGFCIRLRPGLVEVWHMMRFNTFARTPELRAELRRACQHLANIFGAERALYLPEFLPRGGKSLDEVADALARRVGRPADTLHTLRTPDPEGGPDLWYVDTFQDLAARDEEA